MLAHGRGWFPGMLGRTEFNARVRQLWGSFVALQQHFAALLAGAADLYVCVDCAPLPAYSNGQAFKESRHWLWESMLGRGGTSGGFFYGDHLLLSVTPGYAIDGWLVGNGDIQDRWLLDAFLSARSGQYELQGPPPDPKRGRREQASTPPVGHIGPWAAVGPDRQRPYLADRGFNGARWQAHWLACFQAIVLTVPPDNAREAWSPEAKRWLASHRQPVETVLAHLTALFALKRLNAHSRWGQYTRLAATFAAYNIGLFLNLLLGRPRGALPTLLA
jgi:hypothetical protein